MSNENPTTLSAQPAEAPKKSFLADRRAQRLDMRTPTWNPAPGAPPKTRKFFSAERKGFFTEDIHGDNLPVDAVEITHDEWQALLEAQNNGKQIVVGKGGKPVAANPVVTPAMKRQAIEMQIDTIRRAPDTLDVQRAAALGKPGAKEQLQAIDNQIEALRATLPAAGS